MPNKQSLIMAIAETLAINQKDYMLERICNDLGLEPTDDNPSTSKRVYVKKRLYNKSMDELLSIADTVLNDYSDIDNAALEQEVEDLRGGYSPVEQLIFASIGVKPDITFDLVNNQLHVVNANASLIYDRRINRNKGLLLKDIMDWWQQKGYQGKLLNRMYQSLQGNAPEKLFYYTYYEHFKPLLGENLPALVPQVQFNYDPKTINQLGGQRRITQRIDFLMFLPRKRSIFEIDGAQHYSMVDSASMQKIANPQLYAQMVAEDRMFRMAGYEVFRFGGYEFTNQSQAKQIIINFFENYFRVNKVM